MKKTDLEKQKGKKIAGVHGIARGDASTALGKREQALLRKKELLEKLRRPK